jgi:hypothetical protein
LVPEDNKGIIKPKFNTQNKQLTRCSCKILYNEERIVAKGKP